MIYSGRGPSTTSGFHAFFCAGARGGVPILAHEHKGIILAALLGLWAGMQLFMHLRARRARGRFIDEKIGEFDASGIGGFSFGLFLSSIILVVVGK